MCFASTGSGLWPGHLVRSPDQTLVMTNGGNYIAKVNIEDGSAVYEHQGLFSLSLLTSELFFYCKLKKSQIWLWHLKQQTESLCTKLKMFISTTKEQHR